jgi:hypothetical protein
MENLEIVARAMEVRMVRDDRLYAHTAGSPAPALTNHDLGEFSAPSRKAERASRYLDR